MSADGEVTHEVNTGDQAVLEHVVAFAEDVAAGRARVTRETLAALGQPTFDRKMIDGEYLLLTQLDAFLADASAADVAEALTPARIAALARLAGRVARQTEPYTRTRRAEDLIAFRPGEATGNWRDSNPGNGGGRVPLDVNAYLAPAALDAFARARSRLAFPRAAFDAALAGQPRATATLFSSQVALRRRAKAWRSVERRRFMVELSRPALRELHAAWLGGLPPARRAAIGRLRTWSGVTVDEAIFGGVDAPELEMGFPAISLDDRGAPVPIMSTDEAFDLLLGTPSRRAVIERVTRMFQPIPIGSATPVGLVIANPAYSSRPGDHETFDQREYHGGNLWGLVQNMVREGLERQRERFADDPEVASVIDRALAQKAEMERNAGPLGATEIYGYEGVDGDIVAVPYGASSGAADRSNAVQLWSNARRRPPARGATAGVSASRPAGSPPAATR